MKKISKNKKREMDPDEDGELNQADVDEMDEVLHNGLVEAIEEDAENDEFDTELANAFYQRQIYVQLMRCANALEHIIDSGVLKR